MTHSSMSSALRGGSSSTGQASLTRYRSRWNVLVTPFPAASRSRSSLSWASSSLGGKPVSGSPTECPSRRPRQAASSSMPSRQALTWSRQVAAKAADTQLRADRGQPGLFQLPQLTGGPLDRGGQVGQALRAEPFEGQTVLDGAFRSGQACPARRAAWPPWTPGPTATEAVRRRAGDGAPQRSRPDPAFWPGGKAPRSRPGQGTGGRGADAVRDVADFGRAGRQPLAQRRGSVGNGPHGIAVQFAGGRRGDPAPQGTDVAMQLAEPDIQCGDPGLGRRPVEGDRMLIDRLDGSVELRDRGGESCRAPRPTGPGWTPGSCRAGPRGPAPSGWSPGPAGHDRPGG